MPRPVIGCAASAAAYMASIRSSDFCARHAFSNQFEFARRRSSFTCCARGSAALARLPLFIRPSWYFVEVARAAQLAALVKAVDGARAHVPMRGQRFTPPATFGLHIIVSLHVAWSPVHAFGVGGRCDGRGSGVGREGAPRDPG